MSNLPPGVTSSHPYFNPPDHSHEHIWQHQEERLQPIIEDGAAIFHEECMYAEGRYGDGWKCEKTRKYRFEYSTLESPNGKEWELPDITEWDNHDLPEKQAKKVIIIEERFHEFGPGDKVGFDADPDPDVGQVTIEYKGWKLHFRPQ